MSDNRIVVMGIGGSGTRIVERMITRGIKGIEFVAVNTDVQALSLSKAPIKVQIGGKITRGLGAAGNPEFGRKAAEESATKLYEVLKGADMTFVTTGLGGGTGTGAIPVVAKISKDAGALTAGIVTLPFSFEGSRRRQIAQKGLAMLEEYADTVITLSNDRILQLVEKPADIHEAFITVDDIVCHGIESVLEMITKPGLINLDFADIRAIMAESGIALMTIGEASGQGRARLAALKALSSPLLETSIANAERVLLNITGGVDLTLFEVNEAATVIREKAHPNASLIFGAVIDERMTATIRVTVIATGLRTQQLKQPIVHVPTILHFSVDKSKEAVLMIDGELTPDLLASSVAPYLQGLADLQRFIDDISDRAPSYVRIVRMEALTQSEVLGESLGAREGGVRRTIGQGAGKTYDKP